MFINPILTYYLYLTVNPTCANNMVYSTCASACPLTCANRNDPPRPCPAICVTNCTCPFGMAEHEGRCYNPDDCPVGGKSGHKTMIQFWGPGFRIMYTFTTCLIDTLCCAVSAILKRISLDKYCQPIYTFLI